MGGFAKKRANAASNSGTSQHGTSRGLGSSSGDASSSGKAMSSAHSAHSAAASHHSRYSAAPSVNRSRASNSGGGRLHVDGPPPEGTGPAAHSGPSTSALAAHPKNMDLGMVSWSCMRGDKTQLPPRPAASNLGQACKVRLNTHLVEQIPTKAVHQYAVNISGRDHDKRGLIMKVWESKAVTSQLGDDWIFDGNALAWSMTRPERGEIKVLVDTDAEQGRTPRPGKQPDQHRVSILWTKTLRFDVLLNYLSGRCSFDDSVLESINFLDHLLRENPSKHLTSIKRNFYSSRSQRIDLGGAIQHIKGAYQSMRLAHSLTGARLSVDLDVANGAFWVHDKLVNVAASLLGRRDVGDMIQALRGGDSSFAGTTLRKKMKKLRVLAFHRGKDVVDEYCIEKFVYQTAKDYKFEKDGKWVTIADFFAKQYQIRLNYPDLPLVKMTKGKNTVLPMELLKLKDMQKYQFKLDERQTSTMIKHCATPPADRLRSIRDALEMMNWPNDPMHTRYGLRINGNQTTVPGRVLPAPIVKFGAGDAKPGTSGRWDLKGKKFFQVNPVPLKSWGVCIIPGSRGGKPDKAVIDNFIKNFVQVYIGHGGNVANRTPTVMLASGNNTAEWVTTLWNQVGNTNNMRPQILVFILPDKDSVTYGRIKRSADCRYGVVSQCMQYSHVQKGQPQYISNVCMKFNAKLGGATARAVGPKTANGHFSAPTVVIGADVSHAAPGAQAASTAAITVSMDKYGIRYAAACETNGFRVEMISPENIDTKIPPLIHAWARLNNGGKGPARVMYFRDGVSEGQYAHVLEQEVRDLKAAVNKAAPGSNPQFVVIVGGKRHHIRFFPEKGDKNDNPFPGTLVETGCTHPFEYDFYLNSHAAIKGTSRPMHYHVLMNEAKIGHDELITLLYEQSYQYVRATTPVSQHPAIYYAHLASNRCVFHDPKWTGSSDATPSQPPKQGGSQSGSGSGGKSGGKKPADLTTPDPSTCEKLMGMPDNAQISQSMWYI